MFLELKVSKFYKHHESHLEGSCVDALATRAVPIQLGGRTNCEPDRDVGMSRERCPPFVIMGRGKPKACAFDTEAAW